MKTILSVILFCLSTSAFAEFEEPSICDSVFYNSDSEAQACAKAIFWRDHLDTYYGNRVYLGHSEKMKKTVIKRLAGLGENSSLSSDYALELGLADHIVVVIEEHDMPIISVYSLSDKGAKRILNTLYIDYFEWEEVEWDLETEEFFGIDDLEVLDGFDY